ncbi:TorF family putative porin [Sphingomonas sp. dw_22]|uniref:TorF family putative porin n=1 Tax=Sphingomonas sp. dw_22 TaxID=2721175 RepID=UPI001BD6ACAF|nr:TorF family putative porin [Sphingomonas sp. dw_22]
MRFSTIGFGALMLASTAPAMAQDETAPAPAITINGSATVVSDYKFRGISQTDGNFAVQGGITISHASGFYIGTWGSSIDDYVTAHGSAHQELDLIAGFKKTFGGATFDVGAVYYVYPGTRAAGDPSSSDFIEPYASISYALGPVTAKGTVNYAPKQKALALDQIGPKNDNVYIAGDLSGAIPNTPIGLTAHLGHTFGPSWLAIGKEYTDWSLGATYTYKALTFGVSYVDTDGDFITPTGKNASKGGVLGSIGVSF